MALYRVASGMSHTVEAESEDEAYAIVAVALDYNDKEFFEGQGFDLSEASLDTVEESEVISFTEKISD